ncbi:MAG: hypothetical protein WCP09_02115 [Candidatus Taylorbacteria bacterium]
MKKSQISSKQIAIMFFGIMMGVLGGLFGSILDRYFTRYDMIYEIIVAVLFFGIIVYFTKMIKLSK